MAAEKGRCAIARRRMRGDPGRGMRAACRRKADCELRRIGRGISKNGAALGQRDAVLMFGLQLYPFWLRLHIGRFLFAVQKDFYATLAHPEDEEVDGRAQCVHQTASVMSSEMQFAQ